MATRRVWSWGAALAIGAALGACASPPPPVPPPPPTVVALTVRTAAEANPNAAGRGAPVIVRVYQLASPAGFEKAEFYRLLNQDAATLGADVVKRDEFLLAPSSVQEMELRPSAAVTAIGVFAAYRDFSHVTWRGVAAVPEHQTTILSVTADGSGITLSAKQAPPAPPAPKPGS